MVEENLYQILGVSKNARTSEIKRAYRRLASLYHPDKVEHLGPRLKDLAEAELKKLNHAKSILLDPEQRKLYDQEMGIESAGDIDEDAVEWKDSEDGLEFEVAEPFEEEGELMFCAACGFPNLRSETHCHKCEVSMLEFLELENSLQEQIYKLEEKFRSLKLPPMNFFEAVRNIEKWYFNNLEQARERSMESRMEELSNLLISKKSFSPEEYFETITRLREWWKKL